MNLDTCFVCGVEVPEGYLMCDECIEGEWPDENTTGETDRTSLPADNEEGVPQNQGPEDEPSRK